MKLESLNKGNTIGGASCAKVTPASASKKNIWRGEFDRRNGPREEDMLIEMTPTPSASPPDSE